MKQGINNTGMSLIELLIALSIVGILVGIAYPSYRQHVLQTQREQAQMDMTLIALQLEYYYGNTLSYEDASFPQLNALPYSGESLAESTHRYELNALTATTYEIHAIALNKDEDCPILVLNEQGEKGRLSAGVWVGDEMCW